MNIRAYRILQLTFVFLFLYTIGTGVLTFSFTGFMDFPCFVKYDQANHCIESHWGRNDKADYKIESFLSTYEVGFYGGGCNYQYTESNVLEIETLVTALHLERNGSRLTVNGKGLEDGEEFRVVKIFNWNPWTVSQMEFKNIGLVTDCNSSPANQRIVILGDYGTTRSLMGGWSVLFISVSGFIFIHWITFSCQHRENAARPQ